MLESIALPGVRGNVEEGCLAAILTELLSAFTPVLNLTVLVPMILFLTELLICSRSTRGMSSFISAKLSGFKEYYIRRKPTKTTILCVHDLISCQRNYSPTIVSAQEDRIQSSVLLKEVRELHLMLDASADH